MTTRTLFSVIEVTPADGPPYQYVDWHHDLSGAYINQDGKITDKILDIAEEVLEAVGDEDDEDKDSTSFPNGLSRSDG